MKLRKWVAGGMVLGLVVGGSLVGAAIADADPAGAPNNTGTGQTATSNGTGNNGGSSYGGGSSDNDNDNNNNSGGGTTGQQAADTYNGGVNGEGEFGGTDSVANAGTLGGGSGDNGSPEPPPEPTPGPVPEDLLAGDVIDLFPPNLVPPVVVIPPGALGVEGGVFEDNMGNYFGNIAGPSLPAINDPNYRPKARRCDFESGTHNLSQTRDMFPERCGGPWHPELHKCDYGSNGWRCYTL